MENTMNEEAPEPNKKELKTFSFTRTIQPEETPKENIEPEKYKDKKEKENIMLNFYMSLYEDEITFNVKQSKENIEAPHIIYEKKLTLENFRNNKFLSILTLEKIFDFMQKSFDQNFDQISLGEKELKVKVIINLMDVMTEEINIELPMIKMSSQDEMISLKESMKFLDKERTELKNEIKTLNKTLEELLKKIKEKDTQHENIILEIKNAIENNKIEFQKKLEEKNIEFQKKIEENKTELEKNKNEFQKKIEEKDKEITDLRKTELYVKDKLICEEKETEKEKDKHIYKRELYSNNTKGFFNLEISMFLFQEKIKFLVEEIQENLKNNPSIYESNFNYENLSKKTVHFKNLENVENIFNFLHDLFNDSKDTIKKENDKIIINVEFLLGNKETEVSFILPEKDISLERTIKHFSKTLKEINKNNIIIKGDLEKAKVDFKKDLLEKVYPIGSYYWSSNNKSPNEIFGGTWTKIYGRFLFASDSNHSVGETGGEEKHTLNIKEIPSHSHKYQKLNQCSGWGLEKTDKGGSHRFPMVENSSSYFVDQDTTYIGGGDSHNNMPPYLTANCWKRTG